MLLEKLGLGLNEDVPIYTPTEGARRNKRFVANNTPTRSSPEEVPSLPDNQPLLASRRMKWTFPGSGSL